MAQLNIQEEIFKSIETIVRRVMETSHIPLVVPSAIVDARNDKFVVVINGNNYSVKNGTGIELERGTPVWVTVPDGDYKNAFICAKR